jgi:hypothetical protein
MCLRENFKILFWRRVPGLRHAADAATTGGIVAEREGFDSSSGVEKRQVVDFAISTVSRILRLFEKSVRKRYTAISEINAEQQKCS